MTDNNDTLRYASILIYLVGFIVIGIPYIIQLNNNIAGECSYVYNSCEYEFEHSPCNQTNVECFACFDNEEFSCFKAELCSRNNIKICLLGRENQTFSTFSTENALIIILYPFIILILICCTNDLTVYIMDVIWDILMFWVIYGNSIISLTTFIIFIVVTVCCGVVQVVLNDNEQYHGIASGIQTLLDVVVGILQFIHEINSDNTDVSFIFIPIGFAILEHIVVFVIYRTRSKNKN